MTNFISVQLKKASEVDLAKPLCKFIQQSYPAAEAQAEHCRAAEELSRLRKSALGRPLDKHESALETLLSSFVVPCSISVYDCVCFEDTRVYAFEGCVHGIPSNLNEFSGGSDEH
ncbi:hypothetical protein TURU_123157 [Turdus rufiventris]|nr:hypothetical protein TURU_123157 [Turdus rufiventris]